MNSLKERIDIEEQTQQHSATAVDSQKAQMHNAQINERYLRLKNRIFGSSNEENATASAVKTQDVSTVETAPSYYSSAFHATPAVEQQPKVTEFYTRAESPVFTTEKFERFNVQQPMMTVVAPAVAPTFMTDVTTFESMNVEAPAKKIGYQLSKGAKIVMAVFAVTVVGMLSLIGVNTQTIAKKTVRLRNLESRTQELIEENEDVMRRIDEAKSEDALKEYAASKGIIID